jgi:hypothetical protein
MTDALLEMRRKSERDGGGTYMSFQKNRNGNVEQELTYELAHNKIVYGLVTGKEE